MTTYAFGPRTTYAMAAVRRLDAVRQRQALTAAESYAGGSFGDLDEVERGLQRTMGWDEIDLDHFEIVADGVPTFEMWVLASDNGLVFPIDVEDATAVHCAQSRFWSVDDGDADAIALAAALNKIVPF